MKDLVVNCKSTDCGYIRRTDLTTAYFDDIKKYPVLSSIEERKLLERAKSKNPAISEPARNKLVECNQRFVVSVAKRWQKGDNLMDIINEANIGLLQAIDNYDLERDHRFITYAVWWIRKYINDYLVFKDKPIVPTNALKIYTYLPKVKNDFFMENHRYPTFDEIKHVFKKKYGISLTNNFDLDGLTMSSIDDSYFEPNDHALSETNMTYERITSSNNIEEDTDRSDIKELASHLISYLSDKEKKVIKNFYGIDCEEKSMGCIAREMGVSKERVRQLHKSALKKMGERHTFINNL